MNERRSGSLLKMASSPGSEHAEEQIENAQSGACTADPDFSKLPDTVWIKILQHLSRNDRFRTSLTCTKLSVLLSSPAVWRWSKIILDFRACTCDDPKFKGSGLPYAEKNYFRLWRKVGQYFQHIVIDFENWVCGPLKDSVLKALQKMSVQWKLKSLVLNIDLGITARSDLRSIKSLLGSLSVQKMALKLVHLEISVKHLEDLEPVDIKRFWDAVAEKLLEAGVGEAPALKSVVIGCPIIVQSMLTNAVEEDRTKCLSLPPSTTSFLLSLMPSLHHIGLHAYNLGDAFLMQLAAAFRKTRKLPSLKIEMAKFDSSVAEVFSLSATAWETLVSVCPDLEVSLIYRGFSSRNDQARRLFPAGFNTPLVSIRSTNGLREVLKLASQHCETLKSLEVVTGTVEGIY